MAGYLIEGTEAKRRVSVDLGRFITDLCKKLGRRAFIDNVPAAGHVYKADQTVIRFRDEDYELRFETGGQLGGPGRVSIMCFLIDDWEPIEAFNAGAHRPMRDIVADIRKKFLDNIDILAAPHRERRVSEHRSRSVFQRRMRKFIEDYPEFDWNETREGSKNGFEFSGHLGPSNDLRFAASLLSRNIGGIVSPLGVRLQMDAVVPDQIFQELCEVLRRHKLLYSD